MSPVFRDRHHPRAGAVSEPLRMVLDDETVDALRAAAAAYGMEVEELMVALIQVAADRIPELLGEPPGRRSAN